MAGFYFYNGLDGIRMSGTGPDRRSLWRRASVARFSGEDVSRVLMIGARCVSVFVISASSAGRRRTARRPSRAASSSDWRTWVWAGKRLDSVNQVRRPSARPAWSGQRTHRRAHGGRRRLARPDLSTRHTDSERFRNSYGIFPSGTSTTQCGLRKWTESVSVPSRTESGTAQPQLLRGGDDLLVRSTVPRVTLSGPAGPVTLDLHPVSSGSGYAARLLAPLPGGYTLGGAGQGAAAGCWRFRRCRPRGRAGSGRVPGRPSRCWPSPVFCWAWPAATCWDRETWLSGQARLQITNSPERITASCEPSWPTPSTSMSALPIIQSTCASDSLPPAARKRSESMSMPPWTLNL